MKVISHRSVYALEIEDDSVIKAQASTGTVVSLWRYPVKSMLGEE